jgi:lysophospholipase L1-like esterase
MTVLEVVQLASPVSYNGILFLGDSKSQAGIAGAAWITTLIDSIRTITANWVELPRRVATSGWLVADLATGFAAAKASMPASPAVVVINVGANDTDTVGDGVAWKASYLTLVNDVHTTFPSTTIYLTKIWKRNTAAAKVIMDAKIDELLASYSWLTAGIDEGTILPGADDGATMTSDGLHYSIAGCTAVATAWKTMMGY